MPFNHFEIERTHDSQLVYFGYSTLVSGALRLVDSFACAIPHSTLSRERESILKYLAESEMSGVVESSNWPSVPRDGRIELANVIGLARNGEESETTFHNISMKAALDLARDAENEVSLPTDPIALLRSPLRTQLSLIKELYVDENEA